MSSPRSPSLTVVIPSHNGGELTLACLERVVPQVHGYDRIVVVDNGSWDGTAQMVARAFPGGVEVVARRRAMGFARACNLGARDARTDAILFLNQDLLLASDGLDRLRDAAAAYPEAIVGALLFGPEGTEVQHAGGIVLPNGLTCHPHRGTLRQRLPRDGFLGCDYVTGAVLLVPTRVFWDLGGFDERFGPAYYEETDLCIRARACGVRSLVALGVTARHFEASVTGRDTPRYHFLYHRNRLRFVLKHFSREGIGAFVRAERQWLRSPLTPWVRAGVTRAYVAVLLELPRWLLQRRREPPTFVPQEVAS